MEIVYIWIVIKRWWWLAVIPTTITVLFALPAVPAAISPPETYGAAIRFSAAAPPDAENALAASNDPLARSGTYEDTAYVPWLASEYLVVNLPAWITSSSFAAEVSAELANNGVEISADDVQAAFVADGVRSILTVYYGWDDQTELEQIAAASITVLQNQTMTYFAQLEAEPAQIIPLDEVEVVRTAPPITARLRPFITIIIGFAAGIGLMFLADYLDDIVRDDTPLHQLDIPVLGYVPRD